MKFKMKYAAFLLSLIMLFSLSACGTNPAIQTEESETGTSSVKTEKNEIPEYINADVFARRSYELYFLLSQKEFESPKEMSVNALVQYAFCHLFYENLTDMPTTGVKFRYADMNTLKTEITKQFGEIDADLTTADLYNKARERFEMWEPHYGGEIYYKASVKAVGGGDYTVTTVFYTDKSKSATAGRTVMTVHDDGGTARIVKLK